MIYVRRWFRLDLILLDDPGEADDEDSRQEPSGGDMQRDANFVAVYLINVIILQ